MTVYQSEFFISHFTVNKGYPQNLLYFVKIKLISTKSQQGNLSSLFLRKLSRFRSEIWNYLYSIICFCQFNNLSLSLDTLFMQILNQKIFFRHWGTLIFDGGFKRSCFRRLVNSKTILCYIYFNSKNVIIYWMFSRHVLNELIETEKTYVSQLADIVHVSSLASCLKLSHMHFL